MQVLERTEQQDAERFFGKDFATAAECYASLLRLTEYNAARLGRTRMFNVLAAEAGDPGHPATPTSSGATPNSSPSCPPRCDDPWRAAS